MRPRILLLERPVLTAISERHPTMTEVNSFCKAKLIILRHGPSLAIVLSVLRYEDAQTDDEEVARILWVGTGPREIDM